MKKERKVFDISSGIKTLLLKKCPNNGLVSAKRYIVFFHSRGGGQIKHQTMKNFTFFYFLMKASISRERSYFLIIPPVHFSNMEKKIASNNILKHNYMHEEVLMLLPWSVIGALSGIQPITVSLPPIIGSIHTKHIALHQDWHLE